MIEKKINLILIILTVITSLFELLRIIFGFYKLPFSPIFIFFLIFILIEFLLFLIISKKSKVKSKSFLGYNFKFLIKFQKYTKFFLIIWPIFFLFLIYIINFKFPNYFNNLSIQISNIRIDSENCFWKNNFELNRIIGFSQDSIYLINKYSSKPFGYSATLTDDHKIIDDKKTYNKDFLKYYSGTDSEKMLNDVYLSLKSYILDNNKNIENIKKITGNNFYKFEENIITSFWEGVPKIEFMRPIIFQLIEINKENKNILEHLTEFKNDFFRDIYPIFEIVINNKSDKKYLFHSISINMKDIGIYYGGSAALGAYYLDSLSEYEIKVTNLNNENFINWHNQNMDKFVINSSKIKRRFNCYRVYKGKLDNTTFNFNSPIILEPDNFVKIKIKIVSDFNNKIKFLGKLGYNYKIKFILHFNNSNFIYSNFYDVKIM